MSKLEEALRALDIEIGGSMGTSPWIEVTQTDIDEFSHVTRDPDPMHINPQWCRDHGPFPTTIAFGFLSLSLITHMSHKAREWSEGVYALNYGFDRVRFVEPVPVGSRIRGHFRLDAAEPRPDGSVLTKTGVTVEIEGVERPAVVADWLGVFYPPSTQRKLGA